MESRQVFWCLYAFTLVFAILLSNTQQVSSRPNEEYSRDMAKALQYLEQLDRYYSQMARPRFGRSPYKSMGFVHPYSIGKLEYPSEHSDGGIGERK
ncbi:neuropeptide F-like [Brevipalpus obovatus]|uniref:neuropeptide F-like n=1 Tax=Brevipalpus obovatus TaxID=246614 RepID=UPI003D9E03F3